MKKKAGLATTIYCSFPFLNFIHEKYKGKLNYNSSTSSNELNSLNNNLIDNNAIIFIEKTSKISKEDMVLLTLYICAIFSSYMDSSDQTGNYTDHLLSTVLFASGATLLTAISSYYTKEYAEGIGAELFTYLCLLSTLLPRVITYEFLCLYTNQLSFVYDFIDNISDIWPTLGLASTNYIMFHVLFLLIICHPLVILCHDTSNNIKCILNIFR